MLMLTPDTVRESLKDRLIQLPQNRVWRTYSGGKVLDQIAQTESAQDGHFPEDWIASTTRAINPGREDITEGISTAVVGDQTLPFDQLLATDYDYFLGAEHIARHGAESGKLIKFLDSSTRLHFQCHPTAEFSKQHLNSAHGKFEAYHILAIRDDETAPYIYLGFQYPPSPSALKRIVETQDITTLEACFEKIPIKVGETYIVPGGIPHAIGPGVLMIEMMEPSDWAARIEFERDGFVIPEAARFLKRDIDFALSIFNHTAIPVHEVRSSYQCHNYNTDALGSKATRSQIIGPAQTSCFAAYKISAQGDFKLSQSEPWVGIVTNGDAQVTTNKETIALKQYDKFFCPYGLQTLQFSVPNNFELLQCL